jgi:hypothetical protein
VFFSKNLDIYEKIENYAIKDRSDKVKGKGKGKAIPLQV